MIKKILSIAFIFYTVTLLSCSPSTRIDNNRADLTQTMQDSIVYLEISTAGYEQSQPWKRKSPSESWACACAVGKYEVITTAENIANLVYMKALRFGQNKYVSAKLKVVDYQTNLCLIQLDPNELAKPLVPLQFNEEFLKGTEVSSCWLSSDSIIYTSRGYLDRVNVHQTRTSYEQHLEYVVANASQRTSSGELFCIDRTPIGIACWATEKEIGLIPAEIINKFLNAEKDNNYEGLGNVGFAISELLDPTMRKFLKMPESISNGVYITNVYNLGTGSDTLKQGDCLLGIDDYTIDAHGRFLHPKYGSLMFDHLITSKKASEEIKMTVWRDGQKSDIKTAVKSFDASEMLVPYHEFDKQPQYMIISGFVFQKMTYEYLTIFGSNVAGDAPSHLYHYFRDMAFNPTPERKDIVVLSYVLPMEYNQGYSGLGQMVVSTYNGMKISSISDIPKAQKLNPESQYDVVEFEMNAPTLVISRQQILAANAFANTVYGITKQSNIAQGK
jgi:hypothetical protein